MKPELFDNNVFSKKPHRHLLSAACHSAADLPSSTPGANSLPVSEIHAFTRSYTVLHAFRKKRELCGSILRLRHVSFRSDAQPQLTYKARHVP